MKPVTLLCRRCADAPPGPGLESLISTGLVEASVLLADARADATPIRLGRIEPLVLRGASPAGGALLERILEQVRTPYLLEVDPGAGLEPEPHALERLLEVSSSSGALLVYGDYLEVDGGGTKPHPLADHQEGSLTDGFELGPLVLWSLDAMIAALERHGRPANPLQHHAWYDLRLKGSSVAPLVRLPEPLATRLTPERRASGTAVFDYLTADREAQLEAERVASEHLARLGAKLDGPFQPFVPEGDWPVEASVVIPVRNRVATIGDAVRSALDQKPDFAFNVLVVDNHSTDGTGERLAELAAADERLVNITPASHMLGIGGCWNEAIFHPACGRYAVQLDSDDLYASPGTLTSMVETLRQGAAGMAIGSYTTVDRELQEIPPGLVDHREWTDENGPNNALRLEGLGAPRSFATALVRRHPFPNVSYGEDYAVALRISRQYRVARVFESLYLCRRWEQNTDADLSPETVTRHHIYKDRLRTLEIAARRRLNRAWEERA